MAVTEHSAGDNNVSQTDLQASIVINSNNKIVGEIMSGVSAKTSTQEKIVVGTPEEIDAYIENNNLTYETFE